VEYHLGKLEAFLFQTGSLRTDKEIEVSDELVFWINTQIRPPVPVKKEDIYIRAMYLVSDRVNSFGGCFPLDEHPKLADLLIDSPVLVGHSKERLPIARNFKADLVKKDNANWVKVYFYWLKNSPEANSLRDNIDHGIYKECSIGFSFEFPECSICGEDMRRCQHIPFRTYQKENGEKVQAYFNYRNIIKVHETSLVYRGAVFGTSMTNELNLFQKHDCADGICKFKRVYKESILESLRKAGIEKEVKLSGKMVEIGYTEDEIELVCEKNLGEKVLSSLPQVLRKRVRFVNLGDKDKFKPVKFILQNQPEFQEFRFQDEKSEYALYIYRLDLDQLSQGRRFLCDWTGDAFAKDDSDNRGEVLDTGNCKKIKETKTFLGFKLDGEILKGNYLLRKIKLKDKKRCLFYKM